MSEPIITKQCSRCKQIKPLGQFYKDVKIKDKHSSWCKKCKLSDNKIFKYKNRNIFKKYDEKRRKEHPDKVKAYNSVYYAVKTHIIARPSTYHCRICWNQAEQYHHHLGYESEHRLDVIPVCRNCHIKIHNAIQF